MKYFILIMAFGFSSSLLTTEGTYQFAVAKYRGGGDWYSNPTSVPNLITFCNDQLNMNIQTEVPYVEVGSVEIFNYPFIHLTGHGNVIFSPDEAENMRLYLEGGGFLHIDDNYGMDQFIRPQMKKVFPDEEFVELPFSHPIYHQTYDFNQGLPKVHEHDGNPPQGFGLFHDDRLVCFYTYESDLGDGWEDESVHNDSEETRVNALKMGANIIEFALTSKHE
ncbi:MAG: DUF4159 domain-containing protein [Bacteroidota bacterium]